MQCAFNGAGAGGSFEDFFLLVINGKSFGKENMHNDLAYAARIADHDLGYVKPGAGEIDIHRAGLDAHSSDHAGAEGSSYEIGRRKTFSFALVIGRGIGFNNGPALYMRGNGREIAFINNL